MKGCEKVGNQIQEIIQRVDYLEKLINVIQNNVNSSMQLFIGMLGLIAAVLAAAIYFLVKILVNKRVEEELPKVIQNNPPILYFKGLLNKIQSVADLKQNNIWFVEAILDIDVRQFTISSIEFPLELEIFYYEKRKFTITDEKYNQVTKELEVKVPLKWYNAKIVENGIKVWYKDTFSYSSRINSINWTLKVPNPIYKNFTK